MTFVVAATEFTRNLAAYQRTVQREPTEVRGHEKVTSYFLSPEDYERVVQIVAASLRPYHPVERPEHLKVDIGVARIRSGRGSQ